MLYDVLLRVLQKHLYIVFREKFFNEDSEVQLERLISKHSLLKPELIVLDDEIQGFKKVSKQVKSLEKFPVYIEIESSDLDDNRIIENLDLYSETKIRCESHYEDIEYLAGVYNKTIKVERITRFNDPSYDALLIASTIGDVIDAHFLENDIDEALMTEQELELLFEVNIVSFLNFIKIMNDVLVKGIKLDKIDQVFKNL